MKASTLQRDAKDRQGRNVIAIASASPDADALRRVAEGDVEAMGDVYDRHVQALLRFATRAVGAGDAEDIVQSTFVRAVKMARTYDDRGASGRPWLFGIAVRLIQERRRTLARFGRALLRLRGATSTPWMTPRVHPLDIEKGLARLSEAKRVVIVLAEVEGFSCEEIARALEVPVGTVWTRLHHARRDLRKYYGGSP